MVRISKLYVIDNADTFSQEGSVVRLIQLILVERMMIFMMRIPSFLMRDNSFDNNDI